AQSVRSPAHVEPMTDHLDLAPGQPGPMDPPQQLLGLAGEHRPPDHVPSSCLHVAPALRLPAAPGRRDAGPTSTRGPAPLAGRKPTRGDLAAFATPDPDAIDDVLPGPGDAPLRLLIVGINPGLWTAAVNAPFARPGNRFWPSLHRAGLTSRLVDASRGLDPEDEQDLHDRGVGITNMIGRATVRADELTRAELRRSGEDLVDRVDSLRPRTVAIAGITAFRTAYALPKAALGLQDPAEVTGWPADVPLWVVPQPSGLNAHANIASLAATWRDVARRGGRVPRCAAARPPAPCGGRRGGPVHDPDGARGHRDRHLLGRALPPHARAAVEPAGRLDRADRPPGPHDLPGDRTVDPRRRAAQRVHPGRGRAPGRPLLDHAGGSAVT